MKGKSSPLRGPSEAPVNGLSDPQGAPCAAGGSCDLPRRQAERPVLAALPRRKVRETSRHFSQCLWTPDGLPLPLIFCLLWLFSFCQAEWRSLSMAAKIG